MSQSNPLPRAHEPVRGPIPDSIASGAVESLGAWGRASRELFDAGFVPADVLMGMTLYLLAHQPRRPRADGQKRKGAVSGEVWVREQMTVHRPVRLGQELEIRGEAMRRYTRRGRRYGVTTSETRSKDGELLVSNCTTGLLQYRKHEGLEDQAEGVAEDQLSIPGPDATAASDNPSLETLRAVREDDRIEGEPTLVTLAMMRVRDAGRDDNPIHTDPEVARREGLAAPIAGGSHVLAFLQEALMRAWGPEALLHGAGFDVRWKAQTYAETRVTPRARIERVDPELATVSLEVEGEERTALTGTLRIPLAGPGA